MRRVRLRVECNLDRPPFKANDNHKLISGWLPIAAHSLERGPKCDEEEGMEMELCFLSLGGLLVGRLLNTSYLVTLAVHLLHEHQKLQQLHRT